jgi:predicted nucleotidyltransferase component of viral defense system
VDLARETFRFGVEDEQVERDHLISIVLAVLSETLSEDLLFFGGTALGRTHLPHSRMSEDIDLIALGNRGQTVTRLAAAIESQLFGSGPQLGWAAGFTLKDTAPAVLSTSDGVAVRIQVLSHDGYQHWPSEFRSIWQRYSGVAPARLRVPTIEAFAAWKTEAWADRHAARDLYDLWALAEQGSITPEAAAVFAEFGPIGHPPIPSMFDRPIAQGDWERQVGNQTRLTVTADEALLSVRQAWSRAVQS